MGWREKREQMKSPMKRDERGLTANQALFVGLVTLGYNYRDAAKQLDLRPGALQGWFRSSAFKAAIQEGRFEAAEFVKNLRMEMGIRSVVEIRKLFNEVSDPRLRLELVRTAAKMGGLEAPMRHEHEHTIEMSDSRARAIMERAEREIAEKWLSEGKITDVQFESIQGGKIGKEVVDISGPALSSGEGASEEEEPSSGAVGLPPAPEPESPDRGV